MLKNKVMFLVPGMLLGLSLTAADKSAAAAPVASPDMTVRHINAGRQEILRSSDEENKKANKLMLEGKYDDAISLYRQIAEKLERYNGETFKKRRDFCLKRIEECYLKKADEAMLKADDSVSIGDFEQAILLCKEALKYCPAKKAELEQKINFYEKRRNAAVTREGRSIEKLSPNIESQNFQIQLLIEQGRSLARRDEYMKAKRKFEEVLLIDPYNEVATQNLLGINTRIRKAAKDRANATTSRMMGRANWAAAIPITSDTAITNQENQIDSPVAKTTEDSIEKKLKSIIVSNVSFVDQTFLEVMETLSNSCKRHDPSRAGVNFVLKDRPENLIAPDKAPRIGEYQVSNISIYQILEDLQLRHKFLTFRIDRNAVYVAAAGLPLEKMEIKVINVSLPAKLTKKDVLVNNLNGRGVNMNVDGAYIQIHGNYVVARHTPDNLKKIENILFTISSNEPDMVQIMFKFLEVKQDDLDEMAFNWQYSRRSSKQDPGGRFSFGPNSNALLRHYNYDPTSGGTRWEGTPVGGNREDANYYFNWSDKKNDLSFQVYALDWADNSNILYAPRITTLSGQLANINMSEKHYYPDEWESIDNEGNENFRVVVSKGQPSLEDEQELGIKFSIKPEVIGRRIYVPINIPIKQFVGWLIFDGTAKTNDNNNNNNNNNSSSDSDDAEYIQKPIFSNRSIQTTVTAKDGETVFVGGVVSDITTSIDDKIPILGDIPLIGRLFQAKYTKSQKVNLMIFMTCRIIKPDGSVKYPEDVVDDGIPVFPRNQ